MKMRKIAALILALSVFCTAYAHAAPTAAPTPATAAEATPYPYSGEYSAYEDLAEYISELYIDESYTKDKIMVNGTAAFLSKMLEDNEPLLVELLKSTLESLDPYCEFYTADEYKEYVDRLERVFYGIGVTFVQDEDDYVRITGFAENNDNAEKAGIKINDRIVKVNGEDMTGLPLSEVRSRIIGEEGTTVKLTVLRDGKEIDIDVTRVAINDATVRSSILQGNIGYIQIESFSIDTADEFEDALDYMRENKVKQVILDLRNNGGGHVPVAAQIAESIVPKGKIIDVKYRQDQYDMTYNSNLAKKEFDFIVLVNENTASASEILASAIQDSGAGELLGTQTFGKAVIQTVFPLKNGSVFKLTVGEYITRNGNTINGIGLTPDTYVENILTDVDTSEYTQFDFSERCSLGMKHDNVKAAKERFKLVGLYSGETDDVFDKELLSAVKAFQQTNDMFSYGVLDVPTQRLIEDVVGQIKVVDDIQFQTAFEKFGGKTEENE